MVQKQAHHLREAAMPQVLLNPLCSNLTQPALLRAALLRRARAGHRRFPGAGMRGGRSRRRGFWRSLLLGCAFSDLPNELACMPLGRAPMVLATVLDGLAGVIGDREVAGRKGLMGAGAGARL